MVNDGLAGVYRRIRPCVDNTTAPAQGKERIVEPGHLVSMLMAVRPATAPVTLLKSRGSPKAEAPSQVMDTGTCQVFRLLVKAAYMAGGQGSKGRITVPGHNERGVTRMELAEPGCFGPPFGNQMCLHGTVRSMERKEGE